jgi:hypothetical protein
MQPVLRRGRSALDRALMPGDEQESRLNRLLARARDQGLDGVVLFGAAHLPENLVYYANYTPTTFHGVLIAGHGGPPTLLAGKGGARDHPYIQTLSWVTDIRYAANIGATLETVTGTWESGSGSIGVAGLDTTLPHHVRAGVVDALGDRVVPIDQLVTEQRRTKSAREVEVLRLAHRIAGNAANAAVTSAEKGSGRRAALAAADYVARAEGAHDCRITVGTVSGVATPAELSDAPGSMSAVIAVEYLGYWGMAAVRVGCGENQGAELQRGVHQLRAGVTANAALAAAAVQIPGCIVVNGIGCAPTEPPFSTEPDSPLFQGDVLTVVHQCRGEHGLEFDVRTVLITRDGSNEL